MTAPVKVQPDVNASRTGHCLALGRRSQGQVSSGCRAYAPGPMVGYFRQCAGCSHSQGVHAKVDPPKGGPAEAAAA